MEMMECRETINLQIYGIDPGISGKKTNVYGYHIFDSTNIRTRRLLHPTGSRKMPPPSLQFYLRPVRP